MPAVSLLGAPLGESVCARLSNGAVYCWGRNEVGELGTGTTTPALSPVEVPALANATQISYGEKGGCMLRDNQVSCWGISELSGGEFTDAIARPPACTR
jgi:alpha-tubulin suppressor-like RCC1 family protein